MKKLGTQIQLECDTEGVYAVCASDGEHHAMMISNISGQAQDLNIEGADLKNARWSIIDERRLLSWTPALSKIENNAVLLIEF